MRPANAYVRIENRQHHGTVDEDHNYLIMRENKNQIMWSKGLRCKRLVDDQAGFMADMSSLTFQMHGTDNTEELVT